MSFNYCGPVAVSEAKKLQPSQKPRVLSFGCGRFNSQKYPQTRFFYRVPRTWLTGLDADRQFQNTTLIGSDPTHFTRIDPNLELDEVNLDDAEAIPALQERVKLIMPQLTPLVSQSISVLVASLLYFTFDQEPEVDAHDRSVKCFGTVHYRYPEQQERFLRDYGDLAVLQVEKQMVKARVPQAVSFVLKDRSRPFDIQLVCREQTSSINGFPQSADQIWEAQFYQPGPLPLDNPSGEPVGQKRKADGVLMPPVPSKKQHHEQPTSMQGSGLGYPCRPGAAFKF